jgi:NitT/TauT family transport system ATP-binding protein
MLLELGDPPPPTTTTTTRPAVAQSGSAPLGQVPQRGRLVFESVSKNYDRAAVAAIEEVSLTVEPGEFVVLVGPSGCGKTTLLNIAAGMTRADRGRIELDGQSINGPGPDRAVVFQEHGLFGWFTAAQNIAFGLKMAGVPKPERAARVAAALEAVNLRHSAAKLPHQLSGGQRQRVAIARALVLDPAVLLMDEPYASLDAQTRALQHEQLQDLWLQTGKTVLFVTHSVEEAVLLADRVIVLHAHPGKIRREFRVPIGHPRSRDDAILAEIARDIRKEIEDEVTRVNAELADEFAQRQSRRRLQRRGGDGAADADLGADTFELGGGI